MASAELRVGGQLAASFVAGSDIESRFIAFDNNSSVTATSLPGGPVSGAARFADGTASWTYQFDRSAAQYAHHADRGHGQRLHGVGGEREAGVRACPAQHRADQIAGGGRSSPAHRRGLSGDHLSGDCTGGGPDTRSDERIARPEGRRRQTGGSDPALHASVRGNAGLDAGRWGKGW